MKLNSKEIFSRAIKFFDRDQAKKESNPYRDWVVLIILFFALLILFGIGNIFLFRSFQNGENKNIILEDSILNRKELNEVLNFYAAKETRLQAHLKDLPKLKDPSL